MIDFCDYIVKFPVREDEIVDDRTIDDFIRRVVDRPVAGYYAPVSGNLIRASLEYQAFSVIAASKCPDNSGIMARIIPSGAYKETMETALTDPSLSLEWGISYHADSLPDGRRQIRAYGDPFAWVESKSTNVNPTEPQE